MTELVHLEVAEDVATITLDSAHNRNALSRQLVTELVAHLESAADDVSVKAVLLRSADRYDPARGSLDTWVLLIARSLALDTLRRRVLEARTLEASRPLDDADPEPGPDRVAETRDLVERARAAMTGLTDGQRAALELAYFGGKTSAEVAEMEGIPLGTAKTRIRSGLLRLREALQSDAPGGAQ